jgi:hypothetical protein
VSDKTKEHRWIRKRNDYGEYTGSVCADCGMSESFWKWSRERRYISAPVFHPPLRNIDYPCREADHV